MANAPPAHHGQWLNRQPQRRPTDFYRRHQITVTTNKRLITNDSLVFILPVIINHNNQPRYLHLTVLASRCKQDVPLYCHCPGRLFDFYKITDLTPVLSSVSGRNGRKGRPLPYRNNATCGYRMADNYAITDAAICVSVLGPITQPRPIRVSPFKKSAA